MADRAPILWGCSLAAIALFVASPGYAQSTGVPADSMVAADPEPAPALQTGDGLFSATSGNPALPEWLGPSMFDLMFKAKTENEKYTRHIATSAGIAVFVAQGEGPEHWVQAGRACQRFALAATALGLKHAFLNQPVEVAQLRAELAALIGMPGRRPDIVMRFGYGAAMPFSARRPVAAVMV